MKNIVNCYELDFVKDIPIEMNLLQGECEQLHANNKNLKIVLSVLVLGIGAYFVYHTWFKKEDENKSKSASQCTFSVIYNQNTYKIECKCNIWHYRFLYSKMPVKWIYWQK